MSSHTKLPVSTPLNRACSKSFISGWTPNLWDTHRNKMPGSPDCTRSVFVSVCYAHARAIKWATEAFVCCPSAYSSLRPTLLCKCFCPPVIVTWTSRPAGINIHFGEERAEPLCGVLELSKSKQSDEITAGFFFFPTLKLTMVFNKARLCNAASGNLGPAFEERAGLVNRTELWGCCFGLGRFQPLWILQQNLSCLFSSHPLLSSAMRAATYYP